jgi:hypothetical protein
MLVFAIQPDLFIPAHSEAGCEPLDPPAGCTLGERITVQGYAGPADAEIKPAKSSKQKSVWDVVQVWLSLA